MWTRNRIGPSTVPCGTPDSTGASDDDSPSTTLTFLLSVPERIADFWEFAGRNGEEFEFRFTKLKNPERLIGRQKSSEMHFFTLLSLKSPINLIQL